MAKKIVLAGACRTAIGTMGGELSTIPAPELGAIVIKEALKRAGVAPEAVDQVYMGCVIQAGQGQNVARQATLKAGLPIEVPAVTINDISVTGKDHLSCHVNSLKTGTANYVDRNCRNFDRETSYKKSSQENRHGDQRLRYHRG